MSQSTDDRDQLILTFSIKIAARYRLAGGGSCHSVKTEYLAENQVAAPININTAPKELLTALDERISDSLAEQIIDYRKNNPFKNPYDLVRMPGMERIAPGLQTRIAAKSNVFRIRAEAQVNGTTRVIETVVNFAQGAPVTLYWREY